MSRKKYGLIWDEEKTREDAQIKINEWIAKTPELNIKEFTTVTYTISQNMEQILNFFDNRSTNANAESFNAKLKLFSQPLKSQSLISIFV